MAALLGPLLSPIHAEDVDRKAVDAYFSDDHYNRGIAVTFHICYSSRPPSPEEHWSPSARSLTLPRTVTCSSLQGTIWR